LETSSLNILVTNIHKGCFLSSMNDLLGFMYLAALVKQIFEQVRANSSKMLISRTKLSKFEQNRAKSSKFEQSRAKSSKIEQKKTVLLNEEIFRYIYQRDMNKKLYLNE